MSTATTVKRAESDEEPGRPRQRRWRRRRARFSASSGLRIAIMAVFVLFFSLPMLWLLQAPTRENRDLVTGPVLSFGSIDTLHQTWSNLIGFDDGIVLVWFRNSLTYSALSVAIALVVSIPAGYALAVFSFPGRKIMLTLTLVVMITPAAALVLPIFLTLNEVHLVGSMWSVVLPYSFFPFGVYLTFIHYSTSLPRNLLDAAQLDGCSPLQVFWRIGLPLGKGAVALVAFFSFVTNWANFFLPFVMLPTDSSYTLPVGLTALINSTPTLNPQAISNIPIGRPELALAGLITILPVAVVFLGSQRFLEKGLLSGATKE